KDLLFALSLSGGGGFLHRLYGRDPILGAVKVATRVATPARVPVSPDPELVVNVVYARLPRSAETLHVASSLAHGLGARVSVHFAREVPYPLALKSPPVPAGFTEEKLLGLASTQASDTSIQVYQCRDVTETIRRALKPESVVVIGGPKRWWRTREEKLARILRRDGHHVIFTHAN